MNGASSVVTGGVTVSAATLAPLIQWGMAGFPGPVPNDVAYLLAALIVTVAHAAYNLVRARMASDEQRLTQ